MEASIKACEEVERVVRSFTDTARTYGRVILSELHVPYEEKTVRPVNVGGVLGGSKYVVRDVLFKVASLPDSHFGHLYSRHHLSHIVSKILGHDLKGLQGTLCLSVMCSP